MKRRGCQNIGQPTKEVKSHTLEKWQFGKKTQASFVDQTIAAELKDVGGENHRNESHVLLGSGVVRPWKLLGIFIQKKD